MGKLELYSVYMYIRWKINTVLHFKIILQINQMQFNLNESKFSVKLKWSTVLIFEQMYVYTALAYPSYGY